MKKLLFLALVIASVTTPSFSQESFIELVVKDTMMLQPKAWLYTVTITPDYSAAYYS